VRVLEALEILEDATLDCKIRNINTAEVRIAVTDFSSAERKGETMSKEFTHAYCALCEEVQEVLIEELLGEDTTGRFGGGDIVCTVCGSVLLTVYVPKTAGVTP
jgi:hypothetical protein